MQLVVNVLFALVVGAALLAGGFFAGSKTTPAVSAEESTVAKQAQCETRHPGSKYSPEGDHCVQKFTDAKVVKEMSQDISKNDPDCKGKAVGEVVEVTKKGPGYTDLIRKKCTNPS